MKSTSVVDADFDAVSACAECFSYFRIFVRHLCCVYNTCVDDITVFYLAFDTIPGSVHAFFL